MIPAKKRIFRIVVIRAIHEARCPITIFFGLVASVSIIGETRKVELTPLNS
jgi:hypothetical protein